MYNRLFCKIFVGESVESLMKNSKLSYLRPLYLFFMLGLIVLTISRLTLFAWYKEQLVSVENYMNLFILGFRMDVVLMSYLSLLPAVLLTFMPSSKRWYTTRIVAAYSGLFLVLILLAECITPGFINRHGTRPNALLFDYLSHPAETLSLLFAQNTWSSLLVILALVAVVWGVVKSVKFVFYVEESDWKVRYLMLPVLAFFLFWGCRGSLTSSQPIDASSVAFSDDELANVMGVSSLYHWISSSSRATPVEGEK